MNNSMSLFIGRGPNTSATWTVVRVTVGLHQRMQSLLFINQPITDHDGALCPIITPGRGAPQPVCRVALACKGHSTTPSSTRSDPCSEARSSMHRHALDALEGCISGRGVLALPPSSVARRAASAQC